MKKYIGILIAAVVCFMVALAVQAEDAVVYVNDGGTGDGSSQTSPLGSMSDAIAKVAPAEKSSLWIHTLVRMNITSRNTAVISSLPAASIYSQTGSITAGF